MSGSASARAPTETGSAVPWSMSLARVGRWVPTRLRAGVVGHSRTGAQKGAVARVENVEAVREGGVTDGGRCPRGVQHEGAFDAVTDQAVIGKAGGVAAWRA